MVGIYRAEKVKRLTLDNEGYPFADRRRDFVAGDAKIRSHLLPRYVLQKSSHDMSYYDQTEEEKRGKNLQIKIFSPVH